MQRFIALIALIILVSACCNKRQTLIDGKTPERKFKEKNVGGMDFVYISGGSFMMGSKLSPEDVKARYGKFEGDIPDYLPEHPRHKVTVSGFWMGKYEVSQGQYRAVTGRNPSNFKGDSRRPVEAVSWNDAMAFCEAFGKRNRVTARLPYEAEWEYAVRGGRRRSFIGVNITIAVISMGSIIGMATIPGVKPIQLERSCPMGMDCTTWLATYGSGAWTGMMRITTR